MEKAEYIVHLRNTLHEAESQVYFDQPTHEQIGNALNILHTNLPAALCNKIFHRHHIKKLSNFWVTVDKNSYMKGLVTSDALLAVFHQLVRYCNHQAKHYDSDRISIMHPDDA